MRLRISAKDATKDAALFYLFQSKSVLGNFFFSSVILLLEDLLLK